MSYLRNSQSGMAKLRGDDIPELTSKEREILLRSSLKQDVQKYFAAEEQAFSLDSYGLQAGNVSSAP